MKRVIYTAPDESVTNIGFSKSHMEMFKTEQLGLDAGIARAVPKDATKVKIVNSSEIPSDKTYRDAWRQNAEGVIFVDMPLSRIIHMSRIRKQRDKKIVIISKDWERETGRRNQAQADIIEEERERLRNLPKTFDLSIATTPEELKTLWPSNLPR